MIRNLLCEGPALRRRIADSRDRLYRVALAWCGDEMLADDLVQETIETGILKSRQLKDETKLYSWLYRILKNAWYASIRKNRAHEVLNEDLLTDEAGPFNNCQQLEIVVQVRQAISKLPAEQRQVISLVDLDGLPYCQVAEALEIPIGTVMSRLHRARKGLLARMNTALPEAVDTNRILHLVE
jgi:RNA polymerase sigma-70 factor (ECF subfamily)